MTILQQAQEIAERVAQTEYQKEYTLCVGQGLSEDEARDWASDNAAFAFDKAFDDWAARL